MSTDHTVQPPAQRPRSAHRRWLIFVQLGLVTFLASYSASFFLSSGLVPGWLWLVGAGLACALLTFTALKLGERIQSGAPASGRPPWRAWASPASAALALLLLLEAGALLCFGANRFAPYSRLDLPRRAVGLQASLARERSATSLAFSPDGRQVLIGDTQGHLAIWSPSDSGAPRQIEIGKHTIMGARLSSDGQLLALMRFDNTLELRRAADGALLHSIPDVGYDLALSPDGTLVATAGYHTPAQVWRVADASLLQSVPHEKGFTFVGFRPDNTLITHTVPAGDDDFTTGTFSPDGRTLAIGYQDGSFRVVDIAGGQTLLTQRPYRDDVRLLAFSADGSLLASSPSYPGTDVRVWRVADGQQVALYQTSFGAEQLAFAPDRPALAVSDHHGIALWGLPEAPARR